MISITTTGSFKNLYSFLERNKDIKINSALTTIAEQGVRELSENTPVKTGKTASSWRYDIQKEKGKIVVSWINDNVNNGVNIAIILQTGHGTKNGGYVQGRDYINPAIKPIFDKMEADMWKAVISS